MNVEGGQRRGFAGSDGFEGLGLKDSGLYP